ncbi:hypothetical protein [Thermus antranikianii]|uniref:hypothetical protein n=1 Tax=Thermus antranikianii TaxID=88190 RepID=UPI001C75EB0B|nr:hypothetical protein [Thermus antranikianii]QWK21007.1 MAG: hypothetical protein KNN15_08065 [Thermus antranikianii]
MGSLIPQLDRYALVIVVLGVLAGVIPGGLEHWRNRRRRRKGEPEGAKSGKGAKR